MKKTILYLMNGFGVEQKDSYNIYNSSLMPNLDRFTKEYLFGTLESNELDLNDAYRYFSTGSKLSLTYPFIDEYSSKFEVNPNMKSLFSQLPNDYTIQLFVTLKDAKTFEHLQNFMSFIKDKNPINMHILLDSKNIGDYKEIERLVTKFNYSLKNLPLKTISGINVLKNNPKSYIQILNNGVGEKWRELEKKFTNLSLSNTIPSLVEPFYFDSNFEFNEKSLIFFFNYNPFDVEELMKGFKQFNNIEKSFSLFPMKGVMFPLFSYPTSNICMANTLANLNFKTLMISEKEKIKNINYFCTGLKNEINSHINHSILEDSKLVDKSYLEQLYKDDRFELVIINDTIEDISNMEELINRLKRIDKTLEILESITSEEQTLIVSSLYGIKREIKNDNFSKFLVNFSSKVPVIVKDEKFKSSNFFIEHSNIFALANTLYTNVNNSHTAEVVIKRKGQISKILKK